MFRELEVGSGHKALMCSGEDFGLKPIGDGATEKL